MQTGRDAVQGLEESAGTEVAQAPEVVSESTEAVEIDEPKETNGKKESVHESVKRAFNNIKKGKKDDEEGDAGPAEKETESSVRSAIPEPDNGNDQQADGREDVVKDFKPDDIDPELKPPERLNAKAKLVFNNLPKALKKELHRTIKDLEGVTTRTNQENLKIREQIQKESEDIKHIREAVQPFAADWAERGFSVASGIMSLAVAQKKLTDPQTKLPTFLALARDLEIDPQQIIAHLNGQAPQLPPDITQNQDFRALQERQQHLESTIEQQRAELAVRPIVDQLNTVRQEVDPASGKLKYPELHDENYLQSLKARVTEIVSTEPQTSIAAALLKANAERKQKLFGYTDTSSQARFQQSAISNNNRAQAAATSVRGRVAGTMANGAGAQPPPDALKNPRATTAWVLENLRRGNIS